MLKLKVIEDNKKFMICLCNTETNDLVPITESYERKEKAKQEATNALSALQLRVALL